MRRKILAAAVIALLLPWLAVSNADSAGDWAPGVGGGDYFTYEMYGVYTSNRPDMAIEVPSFERNNTEWVRINITSVEGSIINQIYTLRYPDGSEVTFTFQTDVNPNHQVGFKIAEKGVPICAANLEAGDRIPTAEVTLNQTLTHSGRNANHAAWNVSDDWGDIYFDRETGVLVELQRTHAFANPESGDVVWKTDMVRLIQTNRWQ